MSANYTTILTSLSYQGIPRGMGDTGQLTLRARSRGRTMLLSGPMCFRPLGQRRRVWVASRRLQETLWCELPRIENSQPYITLPLALFHIHRLLLATLNDKYLISNDRATKRQSEGTVILLLTALLLYTKNDCSSKAQQKCHIMCNVLSRAVLKDLPKCLFVWNQVM